MPDDIFYVAHYGVDGDFKDKYKAAKAIRETVGCSNHLSKGCWYSNCCYVIWRSCWWSMEAANERRLQEILAMRSSNVVFVSKNKDFIGMLR